MKRKTLYFLIISFLFPSCQGNDIDHVTITLNPNGGTISQTVFNLEKGTLYYDGLFPTPNKDNFFFSYWTFDNDEDIPINETYTIVRDATLKAQYAKAITISFDTDGGSLIEPHKIMEGTLFKNDLFPTPSKENYIFEKWVIINETEEVEIPTIYEINNDITLKAKYKNSSEEKSDDEKYIESLNIKSFDNADYLYSINFDDYDYDLKEEDFNIFLNSSEFKNRKCTSCSSIYQNGFYGRNFDLPYSTYPEFIIKTSAKNGRYATLGMSYGYSISKNEINTTKNMYGHKILPFLTVDGINDQGLVISENEVPSIDVGRCKGTSLDKPKMSNLRLVRYVLDYAKDIESVEELLKNKSFYSLDYYNELHYMIADKNGNSAVIEFKKRDDGSDLSDIVFYKNGDSYFKGVNTNFSFNGYKGDSKNYTDENSSLLPHSEGVERYNLLLDELEKGTINSLDEMLTLLSKVYYTKSYSIELKDNSNEFWFSEFNYYQNNKTTPHLKSNYEHLVKKYKDYFYNWSGKEKRLNIVYCSRHSVAYDLNNLKMKIIFEETKQLDQEFSLI